MNDSHSTVSIPGRPEEHPLHTTKQPATQKVTRREFLCTSSGTLGGAALLGAFGLSLVAPDPCARARAVARDYRRRLGIRGTASVADVNRLSHLLADRHTVEYEPCGRSACERRPGRKARICLDSSEARPVRAQALTEMLAHVLLSKPFYYSGQSHEEFWAEYDRRYQVACAFRREFIGAELPA